MPRDPRCDDDRCDYDTTGRWVHHPACWEVEETERDAWIDTAAMDAAREDGYARPYIPAQRDRRAA